VHDREEAAHKAALAKMAKEEAHFKAIRMAEHAKGLAEHAIQIKEEKAAAAVHAKFLSSKNVNARAAMAKEEAELKAHIAASKKNQLES